MTTLEQWSETARRFWQKDGVISVTPQNEQEGWIRFLATVDEIVEMVRDYDYDVTGDDDCGPDHYYKLAIQGPRNVTACGPYVKNFVVAVVYARASRKYTHIKLMCTRGYGPIRTVAVYSAREPI